MKNSASKVISLKDSRGSYWVSANTISLGTDYSGDLDADNYLSTVTTIDSRNAASPGHIVGNSLDIGVDGTVDVAYMDISHVLSYVEKGAPIKIISAAQNGGSGLIVSNKTSINSASDLVGKNVAMPSENSIQYLLLEKYLKDNGISIKDVNLSSESCSYMNESIKKGKIDAAITYEPYVDINMNNGSKLLLNSDALMPDHPNIVMIASDDFISKHPNETKHIVKIHESTTNSINNNSSKLMGMVPLNGVLDPVLKQQFVSNVSLISGLSDEYIQNVNNFMNIEIDLGYLKQPIPQEKLFWLDN